MWKLHVGISKQGPFFLYSIVTTSLLVFYTDYIGLNPIIFGAIYLIFGFWNAINDPLLGYYSDKLVSQGKKRLFLMKVGIPIMLIGFLIAILLPPDMDPWLMVIVLLMGLLLYEAGKALFDINHNAYTLSIVQDPQERSKLNMYIFYVGIIPGALVGIIPTFVLTGGVFSYYQILIFFVVIAIVPCAISWYSTTKMPLLKKIYLNIENNSDGEKPLKNNNPLSNLQNEKEHTSIKNIFKDTLRSTTFRYFIGWRIFVSFYQAVFLSNLIYMMNGVLGVGGGFWSILIAGIGGLTINLLYPLLIKLRDKYGTINILILTQIIAIPGYIIMGLSSDIIWLLVGYGLSTVALSGLNLFEIVILGDVTDKDYLDTEKEKRGLFVAIYTFFATLASSFSVFLVTIFLFFFNYVKIDPPGIQSVYTQVGIRIMTAVVPIVAIILGILILKAFPLQGENYHQFRVKYVKYLKERNNYENKV